jgi:copper chaperone
MTSFEVKDMSCGHCTSTIAQAVRAVDQGATVQFDLATHRVTIDQTAANAATLCDAIRQAGYTPVAVEAGTERVAAKVAPARGGCCCG